MSDIAGLDEPNETRDTLAEGMINLLRPAVEEVDDRVKAVR